MKIKSFFLAILLSFLFMGCGSSKQNRHTQSKKDPTLQPFHLIITSEDEANAGIVYDMYSVIGEKLEEKFPKRIITKGKVSQYGIKINITVTHVDYVPFIIRYLSKENSGDARLKAKVEITDLYKDKLIHEAYLSKKSAPRRGKGKSTSDHVDDVANDIVFILKSSRLQ